MQARCLTQHAESTVHRVAQEVFLAPDKPISQCLPYSVADQSLFKGNVPQPQDWLRAWRACQTPSSFQSAMTFFGTDDYIAGESRGLRKHGCSSLQGGFDLFFLNCPAKCELAPVLPQLFGVAISGLANMILVMHWAVKKYRKERLLQASSISISIDDRKDYRVMRYRCDLPAAKFVAHSQQFSVHSPQSSELAAPATLEEWCESKPLAVEGLLGVFRLGQDVAENTLESHDKDKGQQMEQSIQELLKRACQDPEGVLDEEALTSLQGRIRHFASDQGPSVGKCGKVLASEGRCPNLAYINFDAAHQVRIASKDPLHALPGFDLQWQRLFGPGALIPSIHNSEIWHARLLAAQKQVLKIYEHQGGIDKVKS